MFYDIFKLNCRAARSAVKVALVYYTLDTFDCRIVRPGGCPPACLGTSSALRSTSAAVAGPDRDRARPQADAAAGSFVRSRAPARDPRPSPCATCTSSWTARLTTSAKLTRRHEAYIIANPGEGLATRYIAHRSALAAEGEARRRRGRARAARSGSRTAGVKRTSTREPPLRELLGAVPVGRKRPDGCERRTRLRLPAMLFDDDQAEPVFGRLNTDRPHQFKAQFIYALQLRHERRASTSTSRAASR